MRIVYCHFLASCIRCLLFRLGTKSNYAQKKRCVGELLGSVFVQTVYIFSPFFTFFLSFSRLFNLFNSFSPFLVLLYPSLTLFASYLCLYSTFYIYFFSLSFFLSSFLYFKPFCNLFYPYSYSLIIFYLSLLPLFLSLFPSLSLCVPFALFALIPVYMFPL